MPAKTETKKEADEEPCGWSGLKTPARVAGGSPGVDAFEVKKQTDRPAKAVNGTALIRLWTKKLGCRRVAVAFPFNVIKRFDDFCLHLLPGMRHCLHLGLV